MANLPTTEGAYSIEMVEGARNIEITRDSNSKSWLSFQYGSNSWRGLGSINLSRDVATREVEEIDESEIAAEAGDDGGRWSLHGSSRREINEDTSKLGLRSVGVVSNDALIYSYSCRDPTTTSPVSPLFSDIISAPVSDHPLLISKGDVDKVYQHQNLQQEANRERCSLVMEYISILSLLGVFGIVGIFIRYILQILFGPDIANVTNDHSALYIDLPSNMVGSFFMGWVGVVFKRKISLFSEALAIGLSTGLMGSITTFTSWIQQMINLTTEGHWMTGMIGFLIGMELAQMSLALGIESAKLVAYVHSKIKKKQPSLTRIPSCEYYQRGLYGFIMCMFIIGILWGGSIILSVFDLRSHHKKKLWIACMVGPFGVWIRWYLACLNGQGIGTKKNLKWLPVGTLITNLMSTILMATLSTIHIAVKGHNVKIVIEALQLGFLGCWSTVSTFVVEVRAMHQSGHSWRAYVYILLSLIPSFIFGTLIYSIPVWMRGYSQT